MNNDTGRSRVSVIMPVYNCEDYLAESIESVLGQSLQEIELICVDDGSTDGSLGILRSYEAEDDRVCVMTQANAFAGAARNRAISIARGDYITFLDADDLLVSDAVQRMYEEAVGTKADVVVSRLSNFSGEPPTSRDGLQGIWIDVRYVPKSRSFAPSDNYPFIFNFTPGGPGGKCYSLSFVKENDLRFLTIPKSEDFFFVDRANVLANRIALINEPLYLRRLNPNSLENTKERFPTIFWDGVLQLKDALIKDGIYDRVEQSFVNQSVARFHYNISTVGSAEGEWDIMKVLYRYYHSDLGLDFFPKKYYYDTMKRDYLIDKLNEHFGLGISKS